MGPCWSKTAGFGPPFGMAGEKTPYSNLGRLGILSKWASRE